MNIRQTPDEFLQRKENEARETSERALQPMVSKGSQAQTWLQNGGLQDAFPKDETIDWQKIKNGWKNAVEEKSGKRAAQRQRLYQAFSGDPLAAVPGGIENRNKVEAQIASSENIDAERKKVALAYYFSKNDPEKIGFVYENIDQFCEEFSGGKKATPEQVFDDIAAVVAYQKDLPEDYATYQKWREERNKTTGFWNGLGGMIGIIPRGFTQYLANVATAIVTEKSNETQEDGRTNISHLEEEQRRALLPELHRNTVEWEAEKNRARREYYKLDAPALETGFGQVPARPNKLGVYDLPALPGFNTSELSEAASAQNKEAEDAWLAVIERNRDKYPWAHGAKSAAEVQEAYWNEIERKYKEATGGLDTSAAYEELQRKLRVIDARRSGEYERLAAKLDVKEKMEDRIRTVRQTLEDEIHEQQKKYHPGNLDEDTVAGFWGEGSYGKVVGKSLAIIWDQFALSILPMMATHLAFGEGASTAVFAGAMEGEGYNEADDANLSPEKKLEYARWHAAYEVIPELIFGWIPILHKMTPSGRGAVREALPNAVADYVKSFAKGGASDTVGELMTFCFEKAEDAALGIGLPNEKTSWDDLTGDEKRQFVTSGLAETIIGSFFTAGFGEAWARRGERGDIKAFNLQGERWLQVVESRIAELREKETLEDAEASELRELETVLDNGNFADFVRVVQREALREAIHTFEKREGKTEKTPEPGSEAGAGEGTEAAPIVSAPETSAKTSEDAEEGELEASDRRARELKLKRDLPHNPDDTAAAVEAWKKKFPGIKIEIVTKWSPEQIRILRERGVRYPEKAKGQYDRRTDTVILNVSNLRPSEVPFKILHEVGLHAGIRRAFGEDAANNLFRAVFEAAQDAPLMQQIIDAYKLRSPLLDEKGEAIYDQDGNPEYDDMTDAQKCEAAEEYLAFTAETYGVSAEDIYRDNRVEIDAWGRKQGRDVHDLAERRNLTLDWMNETGFKPERPGWWKRLISQIRVWLAQNGFGHLRDEDIETIIQKAAKAARERNTIHPDRGSRYSLGGEIGAGRMPDAVTREANRRRAIEMEDAGADEKTIWKETGWNRGKDKKWKFGLPDPKVRMEVLTSEELLNTNGWYLWDFIEPNVLFEAYPELKDVIVRIENLSPLTKGHYDPEFNEIVLNRFGLIDDSIDVLKWREDDVAASKAENTTAANEQLSAIRNDLARIINDTLVHEVQHAIQEIEGFAKGTNVNAAGYLNHETDDPVYAIKEKQEQLINQDIQEMMSFAEEKLHISRVFLNDFFQDAWAIIADYAGKKNQGDFKNDFDEFLDRYAPEADAEAREEAYDAAYRLLRKQDYFQRLQASMSADQTYKRFAGEVEARNVQKRAGMTDDERRNTPPSYTEDVHRAYQIVRYSVDQINSQEFKDWFKDSKVVDEDGKPLVVYHGTNWDIFSEKPGDAAFSDKHISTGSGDYGFYGRGFYFAFGNDELSEKEAGFYGNKVYPFYLSIQKPFYFFESLLSWNGKRVFDDDVVNSVELLNAAKLFPELLSDIKLYTYDKEGDSVGEISIPEYADMFNKVYREKKFEFRKDAEQNELVIEADPVEHSENGETWTEYGFSVRTAIPKGDTDLRLIATHYYLEQGNDVTVDVSDNVLHDFYGEKEFRAWLEKEGYDGVMQSKDGDEVVAFRPEQIKSATENVGTFDPNNPDVRYSVSPVWTGSAADYEQPDLNFVGTGEGAQVYGWGLYGSEEEGVGRWYAKADVRRKGKYMSPWQYAHEAVRAAVTLKGGRVLDDADAFRNVEEKTDAENAWEDIVYELDDYVTEKVKNDFSGTISAEDLKKVAIRIVQRRIKVWNDENNSTVKYYKNVLSYLLDEDKKGEIEFRDLEIVQDKGRNLYKQTFWPDREENLLDWDLSIEPDQAKNILTQMEKEKLFDDIPEDEDDALAERFRYLQRFLGYASYGQSNISGQTVYETLAKLFKFESKDGDPKAASEFLYRAGIDGVTYIGHESGARNFVAFSDKDIRVDEHIRFSVDSEAFRNWFKDSKVVDENGKPLVVYHDTNAKIYVNKETGENWDDLDWKAREEWEDRDDWDQHWIEQDFYTFSRVRARRSVEYPGFFFSPSPDPNHEYGERRIAAYLSIQNPAINPKIEDAGVYDDSGEKAMKKLIEQGYDGIIRKDDEGNVEEYIAFYPEQIKSVDNAGTFDPNNPDIRYSVSPVWTGSAADYEQPDLHYVGTGEGNQVYGWGLYGSEAENVGRWYAKTDAKRKNKIKLLIAGEELNDPKQYFQTNLKGKVDFSEDDFAVAVHDVIGAVNLGEGLGLSIDHTFEHYVKMYGEASGRAKAARYLHDLNRWKRRKISVKKPPEDYSGLRHLYKQTFWPDKEENLIDWFDRVSDDQLQQIADEAVKENIEPYRLAYTKDGKNHPNISGDGYFVYKQIVNALGSPKAASEFLYRAGIDGMTYIGGSSGVRNYVAFSDQDIRVDDHIRFALDVDGNEDLRAYIDVLKPYVPTEAKEHDGAYYAGILKEKAGVEISPETAMGLAEEAVRQRRKAKNKKDWQEAYSYFSSANPLFDYVVNSEMVETIRPSHRFEGEDFSGTFISPEFVQYSEKKQRSEYKTERGWRNYLRRREEALASAKGAHSDELAKGYVLEHGGDELDIEQQIIDLFRNLKRPDIKSAYSKFKQENFARDILAQHEYEELMEERYQREIEDSVISIIQAGQPVVTEDWIPENREVFNELYKKVMGKEAPYKPSKADMEAINAALVQEGSDVAAYAKAYKDARAASKKEAMEQIADLRRGIIEGKTNAVKLQKEANKLLKTFGLEGDRRFTGRILELMNYQTGARRQKAFDNLMEQIKQAGTFKKKMDLFNRIGERLQQLGRRADTGRKAVGVRDEATQQQIDKIREIAQMSPAEIYERQGELQEAINAATENGDSPVLFEEEMALLGKYGDLINKSVADLTVALADLNDLAVSGKRKILAALQERAGEDRARIDEAIDLINHGDFAYGIERERLENKRNKERRSMKNHALYDLFDSFNLWGKLTALNLASEKDMRETVFYRMQELTHECARNKDTLNEKHQTDTINAIDRFFGTKGAFERAAKLNELRKVEKKTGVFRRYLDESGKEFEYSRLSVEEAREMLKDYDRAVAAGARPALEEYAAEAIRHQLRMSERKLDLKKVEFIDGVTEKIMKAANEEGKDADRPIVIPRPKLGGAQEMELSQMQALYQYLMWQQKNTRYKMFFRGWTQESISQLESFMLPEVKRFGEWMAAQLDADRKDIDPVYQKLYMTAFPHEEHYFPAVYDNPGLNTRLGSPAGVDLNQTGAGAAPVQYNPGALKMRVFHLGELRLCDALTVFENHRMIMTHFVTHGEAAREIRALFANKDVRRAIEEKHGDKRYQSLTEDIKDFINGGHSAIDRERIFGKFYSAAVRSKMMINVTSGVKQTLGALTYMQDIPVKDFISGVSYAMAHPKEVWETLGGTDYFKNRWRSGANYELRMLLDQAGTETGKMNLIMSKADTLCSIPLRLGDAGAVLFGGYAVYRYQYQQGIQRGLSEKEAKARALLEWEMSTERTQQSNQVHMQNKLQKGTAAERIFTTYLSNQILMWNHYAPRFYKKDWKNGARGMLAMAITSVAMTTANQLFRNGIWVDDWEFWDYFWDFFSDVLSGGGSLGVAAKRSIETTRAYNGGANVLESDLAKTFRAAKNLPGDISDEDSEAIFKDALDLLTLAGYFYQPILPAAAGVREVKKLYKTAQTFDHEDE